ncbi:MAG: methionyl-tRNA formyltransferase [Candidatus Omnitrophica bacterium]|nr:methionyl-tRNA formyltransferase [Candidatus Omnitrophota bacterium]
MKIVFFGSDDFASRNLESLICSRHEVLACVTQPDRPKGRDLKISLPMPKIISANYGVDVLQPKDLRSDEFLKALKGYGAELFVVIAYGRILTKEILDLPMMFSINVHGSLLPKYRGAAPINWAIINGDQKTGMTIAKIDQNLDSGDILKQKELDIKKDDTSAILRQRMINESVDFLLNCLDDIENNNISLQKQDCTKVSFAPKLTKELGLIDWNKSAEEIRNLVRGLLPWPSAYTKYKGKILKILETEVVDQNSVPGKIINVSKQGFVVGASDKALLVKRVHLESSKQMDAASFVAGHKIEVGTILG